MVASKRNLDREALIRDCGQHMRELGTGSVMLSAKIAKRLGITPTDLEAMELLDRNGPMTAGEIAVGTGLTSGAVTGMIDRLVGAGYAKRQHDPADRRRVIVTLAPAVIESRVMPLYAAMTEQMRSVYDSYTDQQLHTIADFLSRSAKMSQPLLGVIDAVKTPPRRRARGVHATPG